MPTLDEVREKYMRHIEEMKTKIYVDDGFIIIEPLDDNPFKYEIKLDRCNTHEKILGWVAQLIDKSWMNMQMLDYFIELAWRESALKRPNV